MPWTRFEKIGFFIVCSFVVGFTLIALTAGAEMGDFHPSVRNINDLTVKSSVAAGSGVSYLLDSQWSTDNSAGDATPIAIRGYIYQSGNTTATTGHLVPVLGWARDVVDSEFDAYAVEGRVDGDSAHSGIIYTGVLGMANWADPDTEDGTTFDGTVVSLRSSRAITDNDESTPRAEGTTIGAWILDASGGATNVGIKVDDQTGGNTADVGVAIYGADTYALWVGAGADNTDAANGITFGSSGDTNLYRSAADTLKTDDSLIVTNWISPTTYIIHGVDKDTIDEVAGGDPATHTLTPSASYVELTCNDANTCDITMGETGMVEGIIVTIVNVSSNVCDFADSAGVSEIAGAFNMGQYDTLKLIYDGATWIEICRSNN